MNSELKIPLGPRLIILDYIEKNKLNRINTITLEDGSFLIDADIQIVEEEVGATTRRFDDITNNQTTSKRLKLDYPKKINVRSLLTNVQENTDDIVEACDKGVAFLTRALKSSLTRIVVSELVKVEGTSHPSMRSQEALADSILTAFPKLVSTLFFNPGPPVSGTIPSRLKTLNRTEASGNIPSTNTSPKASTSRSRSTPQKRKPPTFKRAEANLEVPPLISPEDHLLRVNWMKNRIGKDTNQPTIVKYMIETRGNRIHKIFNESCDMFAIFEEYPRLKDFDGELLDMDYLALHPSNDLLVGRFPSLQDKVLEYINIVKPNLFKSITSENVTLRTLIALTEILTLPGVASGKSSKTLLIKPAVLQITSEATNPDDYENIIKTKEKVLPYLLWLSNDKEAGAIYLKAQNLSIYVGNNLLTAFDLLYKVYYIFDLMWPPSLGLFYVFMDLLNGFEREKRGTVATLVASLEGLGFKV